MLRMWKGSGTTVRLTKFVTSDHRYIYYRPQRSYVFTRVCLSTGGEYLGRYPPGPGPQGEYLGRYPLGTRYTPLGPGTPPLEPGTPPWDQVHPQDQAHPQDQVYPPGPGTPPRRRLLLRTVRILLECILV